MPRGSYGSILHALTFGLFGDQKNRTERPVEGHYKVSNNKNEWYHVEESAHEKEALSNEHVSQLKHNHTKKLVKVEKKPEKNDTAQVKPIEAN